MNVKVKVQQLISKWDVTVSHFHHGFSSFSQKDVRSDPKAVQEVSAATTDLLENLGALAVEVYGAHTCTHKKKLTKSASLFAVCFQSSVFRDLNFELWIKSMFTKNFLHVVPLLCPLVICDTCGGLSFFFFPFNLWLRWDLIVRSRCRALRWCTHFWNYSSVKKKKKKMGSFHHFEVVPSSRQVFMVFTETLWPLSCAWNTQGRLNSFGFYIQTLKKKNKTLSL